MSDPRDEPRDPPWLTAIGLALLVTGLLAAAWIYQHLPPA